MRKLVAAVMLMSAAVAGAQNLEDALERTYKGAWVLTRVEMWSDCTGFFTNNDIAGVRVSSRGSRRFEPGELARIEKVSLKAERVELYAAVDEPVLVPRREGPFTLFDERRCKAELRIAVPREAVRRGDAGVIHGLIEDVLSSFDTREAARHARAWNGREREPYPPDYERTLARYEVWKVEQANARIAEVQAAALEEANRIAARLEDNPDYLRGLSAGSQAMRSWTPPACSSLPYASFAERSAPPPPRGIDDPRAFERGFKDGQALVYHVKLAQRAPACLQPLPALP
ncbi:MAG TPA: hypothetical protein P5234_11645 [Thermoanaerobaculaceae bacterium]|nr:hypothetical protein [Thermoanaerobaculaceae bacterium]HRS16885.1 hypothetical protein [Thermoanaerobaculaceae bacterium]